MKVMTLYYTWGKEYKWRMFVYGVDLERCTVTITVDIPVMFSFITAGSWLSNYDAWKLHLNWL
jgi:hypothetical protein